MPELRRILLVGNYAPDRQQSMLRFTEVMQRGLLARDFTVTVLQPTPTLLGERSPARGFGKWLGHADKYLRFPAALRAAARAHDVVHIIDHSNAMYCHELADVPHVVTCHDLLAIRSALGEFPENRTRWSGRRLQQMILRGLQAAQLIACVSRATMADLKRVGGIDSARTVLVPNGLNHPYRASPVETVAPALAALGLPAGARYLLHVGGNHWYKHRSAVLRIAGALRRHPGQHDLRLVMVGEHLDDHLRAIATTEQLTDHLHELPGVSNDQLNALYNGAIGLVFPSLHEGFGWPVIEAQAAGCPVFIADRAPLPEVAGEHALRFDPLAPEDAAAAILAALPQRNDHVAHGLSNASHFTTASMIDGYLALYRRACA